MTYDPAKLYGAFKTATAGKTRLQRFNTTVEYDDRGAGANRSQALNEQNFSNYLLQAANENNDGKLSASELDGALGIGLGNAKQFMKHHSSVNFGDMDAVAKAIDIWQVDNNSDGKMTARDKDDLIEQLYQDIYDPKSATELVNEFKGKTPTQRTQSEIRFGRDYEYTNNYGNNNYDENQSYQDASEYFYEADTNGDDVLSKAEFKESTGFSDTAVNYIYATNSTMGDVATATAWAVQKDGLDDEHNGVISTDVKQDIETQAAAWKKKSAPISTPVAPAPPAGGTGSSSSSSSSSSETTTGFSFGGLFSGLFGGELGGKKNDLLTAGLVFLGVQLLFGNE